jgi:hypothetical protein
MNYDFRPTYHSGTAVARELVKEWPKGLNLCQLSVF